MKEPIHTHLTKYYLIKRPILWFAKDEKIPSEKLQEYFTATAIRSLLKFEFIVYFQ
jgi:hypothetical protein